MTKNPITQLLPILEDFTSSISVDLISPERKAVLQPLINYIQGKHDNNEVAKLNFICTHNSRRSQLTQAWAKAMSVYFEIDIDSFSGGVEVTAFNESAINALINNGFKAELEGESNPKVSLTFSENHAPLEMFSKKFDEAINPTEGFAAIMTCSDADANCPFIAGAEKRIPVKYDDPKLYDGTSEEAAKYAERSRQIATEMFYIFSQIEKS
ncbi:low molecular weight phosphatase family protein [Roseivirga echinicomitans]|uniref:Protein-tyrosine-phosphatase n=1 Tax=Roseivirga echinicomitans TaxID=296218 RepID=A0A150XUC1_9BACT|nr:protein-tyrosine-phosphatase [Roseivirga echinicomitans]KYG82286.1 protein-tyrosine-phosphatase [Roseivirga echinicomitans]